MSRSSLSVMLRALIHRVAGRSQVPVFHHIPKCAGHSVIAVLEDWYEVVRDYRLGWDTSEYADPVDLRRLEPYQCLCGHFEIDGGHLHQRYPEVLASERFFLFTFVRDPLELKLSLYRYELEQGLNTGLSLRDHLFTRRNYMAARFPATSDDYQEVIDRYDFVGVVERLPEGLEVLARSAGKPAPARIPRLNTTSGGDRPPVHRDLTAREVEEFRRLNAVDYAIYSECLHRFQVLSAEHSSEATGSGGVL